MELRPYQFMHNAHNNDSATKHKSGALTPSTGLPRTMALMPTT